MYKTKPILLPILLLALISAGCGNDKKTAAEAKIKDPGRAVVTFHTNKLEREIKKLKPAIQKKQTQSLLAIELKKKQVKEMEERQKAAAKIREAERKAEIKKKQQAEAEKQRLADVRKQQQKEAERQQLAEAREQQAEAQKQKQQAGTSESNTKKAPSSDNKSKSAVQQPAYELPDHDGYGYEERKKWHDDQVEWGIKQGYIDLEDAP